MGRNHLGFAALIHEFSLTEKPSSDENNFDSLDSAPMGDESSDGEGYACITTASPSAISPRLWCALF